MSRVKHHPLEGAADGYERRPDSDPRLDAALISACLLAVTATPYLSYGFWALVIDLDSREVLGLQRQGEDTTLAESYAAALDLVRATEAGHPVAIHVGHSDVLVQFYGDDVVRLAVPL